jgi:hypothetical protein
MNKSLEQLSRTTPSLPSHYLENLDTNIRSKPALSLLQSLDPGPFPYDLQHLKLVIQAPNMPKTKLRSSGPTPVAETVPSQPVTFPATAPATVPVPANVPFTTNVQIVANAAMSANVQLPAI